MSNSNLPEIEAYMEAQKKARSLEDLGTAAIRWYKTRLLGNRINTATVNMDLKQRVEQHLLKYGE